MSEGKEASDVVVCFWDHSVFSACIVLEGITPREVAELIAVTVHQEQRTPGQSASLFATMAFEVAESMALANIAPAANTGATLARMHSADNAPGGMGFILVDVERRELMVYGGAGWDEDYNLYQARIVLLETVLAKFPPRIRMDPLEAQRLRCTMMKQYLDTIYAETGDSARLAEQAQVEQTQESPPQKPARKKKATRKKAARKKAPAAAVPASTVSRTYRG